MTTEVESPTGATFIVWTRDSSIHWDTSIELPADVEFDPKNADHSMYHGQLFHTSTEDDAVKADAAVIDCIKAGKVLEVPGQDLVENEKRKQVLAEIQAAVLAG